MEQDVCGNCKDPYIIQLIHIFHSCYKQGKTVILEELKKKSLTFQTAGWLFVQMIPMGFVCKEICIYSYWTEEGSTTYPKKLIASWNACSPKSFWELIGVGA